MMRSVAQSLTPAELDALLASSQLLTEEGSSFWAT